MTAALPQLTIPTTFPWPKSVGTSAGVSVLPSASPLVNPYAAPSIESDLDEFEKWRRVGVINRLVGFRSQFAEGSAARSCISPTASEVDYSLAEILEVAGDANAELRAALLDLDVAEWEALEDGFPVPSKLALENARRLLRAIYKISPRRFEVYPTPDGEVAIDAPGGPRRSVLLLCDSDGGVLCLVNANGKHRRAHYSDSRSLPDGFVREALAELRQHDELAA